MKTINDRVCVITGASSGIGAAFAKRLSAEGAKVVLFARRENKLREVASALPNEHLVVVGDVTRDWQRVVDETVAHFGHIDLLINNAGRSDRSYSFETNTTEELSQVIAINYQAAVLLTHAVLPHMQNDGLVINVSSPMQYVNMPGVAMYCSTKAALSSFSRTLYRELKPRGIHVLDLQPGFTESQMTSKVPHILGVQSAESMVEQALWAAMRGKPALTTGTPPLRTLAIMSKFFPRLADWFFHFTRLRAP